MALSDLYTYIVDIYRIDSTEDEYGGESRDWGSVPVVSAWECRIYEPAGSSTVEDLGQFEGTVYKAIGGNADIQVGDKIVDSLDEYKIQKVYKAYDKSSIHHLELLLTRIK